MKIRFKIALIFAVALVLSIAILYFGLSQFMYKSAETQLKNLGKTIALTLIHNLEQLPFTTDSAFFEDQVRGYIGGVDEVAKQMKGFDVNMIIVLNPDYKVEVGYPQEQAGKDYSAHKDIRDAFATGSFDIVMEKGTAADGTVETDIDILSPLKLADGDKRVLEVKLNFNRTMAILEAQQRGLQLITLLIASGILVALMLYLNLSIRNTALRPLAKISRAMEKVKNGDLSACVNHKSRDEFAEMASQFNDMVNGLRERFELSKYVSKSTMSAIKREAESVGRKNLTLFFSDIRSFTTYSESRDPAHVVGVLNRILSLQAAIIHHYGGDIDKYVGDETMAIFKTPLDALKAAWIIQREMRKNAAGIDNLAVGIGVYEGEVVQGDIGSDDMKNFTVIGDVVNTAARLQAISKAYEILIPETLANRDEIAELFICEKIGETKLKGKEQAIVTWRVAGRRGKE